MPDHQRPTISVTGEAESHRSAERGTVHLTIGFEGPRRADVLPPTEDLHAEVTTALNSMRDDTAGPVTWWASDQIRVWGSRPWNNQGKQLPIVHHTAVTVRAKFSDFNRLGAWVTELSLRDGVTINTVRWALTETTRETVTAQVRRAAVADAIQKATAYAEAAGFDQVHPIAISDPGLLEGAGGTSPGAPPAMQAMRAGAAPGGAERGGIEFTPEQITISATVHARFAAE